MFDLGIELYVPAFHRATKPKPTKPCNHANAAPNLVLKSESAAIPIRKRIEVIADDEQEIIEAARRMVDKYDFVVTSGGIGQSLTPTHTHADRLRNDRLSARL